MTNGSRIERAVSQLPPALAGSLAELLRAPRFDGVLAAAAVHEILQTTGVTLHDLMLALTPVAACWAVPPISEFHVGAVACGDSGSLYFGANMEFAGEALSLCTHAEQSATVNAWRSAVLGSTTANSSPP